MPRLSDQVSFQGERVSLDRYGAKYPLLAREGLLPEAAPFHALAAHLCQVMHADDIDGAMLRLNNLLHAVELSQGYEKGLKAAPK